MRGESLHSSQVGGRRLFCADESEIAQTFYEAVEDYQLVCSEMGKVFDLQVEKSAQNGSF